MSCVAWPSEARPRRSSLSDNLASALSTLATRWLAPLQQRADAAAETDDWGASAERAITTAHGACPMIVVHGGNIHVHLAPNSALLPFVTTARCARVSTSGNLKWEAAMNSRLLTALRLMRLALSLEGSSWPRTFSFRLCLDDICHADSVIGVSLPLLSMVACGELGRSPTLPFPQWMATGTREESADNLTAKEWFGTVGGARDTDLAVWHAELARRRDVRDANLARWDSRLSVAVWRGTVHVEHGATNSEWTESRRLIRTAVNATNWREQARFALVYQKCTHPRLLDVRAKVTVGTADSHHAWVRSGLGSDSEWRRCALAAEADEPKYMELDEQARRFQMAVNVEGASGWADRLRHLLLSGLVVLKQDSGVREWWEPLLLPWVHYVPVSSTLHNLSAAVLWVRQHAREAQAMARAAAELMEGVLSVDGLVHYTAALLRGYARLDATARRKQPKLNRPEWAARFSCDLSVPRGSVADAGEAPLACRFSNVGGDDDEPRVDEALGPLLAGKRSTLET